MVESGQPQTNDYYRPPSQEEKLNVFVEHVLILVASVDQSSLRGEGYEYFQNGEPHAH
jgi:hypothetical protein